MKAVVFALLVCGFLVGCASVPRDAYRLNKEVGEGIQAIHQSNLSFTHYYFSQKRAAVNAAQAKALSGFFATISAAAQQPNAPALTAADLLEIENQVQAIQQQAQAKHEQLYVAEQTLRSALNDDYAALAAANKELSAMLKTIHDIEAAKGRTITALNLQSLETKLNTHLGDGLEPVSETAALLEAIEDLLQSDS
ncbi:hypothetical protein [Salinibius halmophilus]|uniref:hypothetical protein n=1 Tax=Salinibius halmophilus TaxID=1853216 RepID=UPI000E66D1D4|nr:hypothetical protein [Salinibius halmophilus]